jgi:hypothetical protein
LAYLLLDSEKGPAQIRSEIDGEIAALVFKFSSVMEDKICPEIEIIAVTVREGRER